MDKNCNIGRSQFYEPFQDFSLRTDDGNFRPLYVRPSDGAWINPAETTALSQRMRNNGLVMCANDVWKLVKCGHCNHELSLHFNNEPCVMKYTEKAIQSMIRYVHAKEAYEPTDAEYSELIGALAKVHGVNLPLVGIFRGLSKVPVSISVGFPSELATVNIKFEKLRLRLFSKNLFDTQEEGVSRIIEAVRNEKYQYDVPQDTDVVFGKPTYFSVVTF